MSVSKITNAVSLYELARLYSQTFPAYNSEIVRVLNIVRVPDYSDRSDTLGGESPNLIIKQAVDVLTAHKNNKNNPHQETIRSIGTLSTKEINDLLVNKLPAGLIAMSAFGYDYKSWADVNLTGQITRAGDTVTVKANTTALIMGTVGVVTTGTIKLSTISTSWNSSTWYLYIRLIEGNFELEASVSKFTDTITRMYIGSTAPNTNVVSLLRVIKTGKYRLSTVPVGTGMAVGLGTFATSPGIDLRWVPAAKDMVSQTPLPPKVTIDLNYFDRAASGIGGYIELAREGLLLLQVDVNQAPNIYFKIDGDNVVTTASIQVISGTRPTVTKVSNTQFRVSSPTYGLAKITMTATIPGGDTATYSFFTEHRTNLGIWLASHDFTYGTYGGTTKLTAMANNTKQLVLGLGGDGVYTTLSISDVSGGNQVTTKVNESTYTASSSGDSLKLYTFKATDRYGRSTSFAIYVEVRLAFKPEFISIKWYHFSKSKYGYRYPKITNTTGTYLERSEYGPGANNNSGYKIIPAFKIMSGHTLSASSSGRNIAYEWIGDHRGVSITNLSNGSTTLYVTVRNEIGETKQVSYPVIYRRSFMGHSCFTGDSMVLMADGSEKRIDNVRVGEYVMSAIGPVAVWKVFKPTLGTERKLVSFDGKCKTSAEHSFWHRTSEGKEFWATRDMDMWNIESMTWSGPSVEGGRHIDLTDFTGSYDVATVGGWETVKTLVHEDASPETQLYNLRLVDGGSYFIDGYLVSSRDTVDNDILWPEFKWEGEIVENYPKRVIQLKQAMYSSDTWKHYSNHYGILESDLSKYKDGLIPLPRTRYDDMFSRRPDQM